MGGGLLQLVAYGAQDLYLTGNPQITFFKVVYRRHTNFSMESIQQVFNRSGDFGNTVCCTISRNGDLVYKMYLEHTFDFDGSTNTPGIRERYGHSLIKECSIEIGGQLIDKHPALWNRVYSDLTEFNPSGFFGGQIKDNDDVLFGYDVKNYIRINRGGTLSQLMTNNTYSLNANVYSQSYFGACSGRADSPPGGERVVNGTTFTDNGLKNIKDGHVFLPLNFWFTKNPGLALPLIALQYHEVKVFLKLEHMEKLLYSVDDGVRIGTVSKYVDTASSTFKLWVDYIYLDTDERKRFAQVSHEYLIEQLQYQTNTISDPNTSIHLHFNHPIKELIWCSKSIGVYGRNNTTNQVSITTKGRNDPTSSEVSLDQMGGNWKLELNGHDRFKERDSTYFTRSQIWKHHTGYGALTTRGIMMRIKDKTGENTKMHSGRNWQTGVLSDNLDGVWGSRENKYLISGGIGNDSIAVYSFALKPEEHQPSGTCNFSRIDNAVLIGSDLKIGTNTTKTHDTQTVSQENLCELTIFAVNYNILRIMSGMGGLAFSN